MNFNPPGASAYERWLNQWDEEAWAALPPHRVRMLTSAMIRRELEHEVAREIAPVLFALRTEYSMRQIAAALTCIDHTMYSQTPVGDRMAVTRSHLFHVLRIYVDQLPDEEHTAAMEAAMLCEHGTRDWCGSTYCGCDEISEQIDGYDEDNEKDAQDFLPGYEWDDEYGWCDRTGEVMRIRRRMKHAFMKAMAQGYGVEELTLLLGGTGPRREVDPIAADTLWCAGIDMGGEGCA